MLYLLSEREIRDRINSRKLRIGFIGLGRVGLPLAATLADEGFEITGVDIKKEIVAKVSKGESPYPDEVGLAELLQRVVAKKTLKATNQIEKSNGCDLIILAVPTLVRGEEPDIHAVEVVSAQLAQDLLPGTVVVLESTAPPFTTQDVVGKTIEERTGLKPGKDFGLVYSPERTQAPQVLRDLRTYPKVMAGLDEKSFLIASLVYNTFAPGIIRMGSLVAAEIEKVIENTYRDVNIAFANELARLCELYGVDAYEIINAANSQPYSHILNPGLVGGHCIPVVPYFIISDARKRGFTPMLIKTARDVNESVFQDVVRKIDKGSKKITILGLSFKNDVKSFETSHTLKLVSLLEGNGCDVTVHDPFLDSTVFPFRAETDVYQAIEGADCVILSTAHSMYTGLDFGKVKERMRGDLIIDVRGVLPRQDVVKNGLRYKGIGRDSND